MKSSNKKLVSKAQENISGDSLSHKMIVGSSRAVESVLPSASETSPFQRSAKLRRTPPDVTPVKRSAEAEEKMPSSKEAPVSPQEKALTSQHESRYDSPVITGVLAGGPVGSPEQKDMEDACKRMDEELARMRDVLRKMKLATSRQRNISMDIKDGLCEIEESVEVVQTLSGFWGVALQRLVRLQGKPRIGLLKQIATQTPPIAKTEIFPARKEKEVTGEQQTGEAAVENKTHNEWTEIHPKRLRRQRKEKGGSEVDTPTERGATPPRREKKKKVKKKKKQQKPRPDALLIKPAEGKTYAEVLKEIREKIKPEDTETEVNRIRQTRAGDILIELGDNTRDKMAFEAALNTVLQNKATTLHLEPKTSVEIRDLDSLSEENEIKEAIELQIGKAIGDIRIHLTKANARGLKAAIVQLSIKGADELVREGFLKVGWVRCRVRRRVEVPRCFRCLAYGHTSGICKGPDRSKLCFKCGGLGHLAVTCTEESSCMLCLDRKYALEACRHLPGSGGCLVFREALEQARKKPRN